MRNLGREVNRLISIKIKADSAPLTLPERLLLQSHFYILRLIRLFKISITKGHRTQLVVR